MRFSSNPARGFASKEGFEFGLVVAMLSLSAIAQRSHRKMAKKLFPWVGGEDA
jgi:hypothetical protein